MALKSFEEARNLPDQKWTIGLLTHGAGDPNNYSIWAGATNAVQDLGGKLICWPGKPLHSNLEFEAQSNVIYDLVSSRTIDGLVIWLAGLAFQTDLQETRKFCQRYSDIPVVTVGTFLEGYPGVRVDNYQGMRDVMSHIIGVHNRQLVAFIRGPRHHQEADVRYQAYLDSLDSYQIPFDPNLVYLGNFKESGGRFAIEELYDNRKVAFDALVAASDNMAIGALKALQKRGVQVPSQVAIAGLNDEAQSSVITPPLTTSPLHFYQQAYQATQMVWDLIQDKMVQEQVVIPTQLLIRQSCGCPDPAVMSAAAPIDLTTTTESLAPSPELTALANQFDMISPDAVQTSQQIVQQLLQFGNEHTNDEILRHIFEQVHKNATNRAFVEHWNEAITQIRQFLLSANLSDEQTQRYEALFHAIRVFIADTIRRQEAYDTLRAEEKLRLIGQINQNLSVTTTLPELSRVLVEALEAFKIQHCYLSLYTNPAQPADSSRLVFWYDYQLGAQTTEICCYPSQELIPPEYLPSGDVLNIVVQPLYFQDDQLGFVIFSATPDEEEIYQILADQISGAIKRTLLIERSNQLYDEAVEARKSAEEANLLKSRFLSMVSHELRTPLSFIVGTIEMMLQGELAECWPSLPEEYRQDMDSIHTSAIHLSRLIGDVLDLASSQAGELRLYSEPLDMGKLLNEVALLGEGMAREKGLVWEAEMPARIPMVWGDRTRLRQVILNLLSNAVKFTEHGTISLTVKNQESDLYIAVSDTGMGVSPEEQESIFDEFKRSERSLQRGYSGMGLGLAINRRLIELHDGTIGVESAGDEESGARFYITLPTIAHPQTEWEAERSRTVLLLTGDIEKSAQLYDYLDGQGFTIEQVLVTESSSWITEIILSPPGAIILDYQPAADQGWQLIQTLKEHIATQDIPVLFYAFLDDQGGTTLSLDYLTKPLKRDQLLRTLERFGLNPSPQGQNLILVVDDDPHILDLHTRLLDTQLPDYQILQAKNGRVALEIIQKHTPDLILLDLVMPEMDGFELLEAMRENERTRNIPVVILTAQILSTTDIDRLQQGISAVLSKGVFSMKEVINQVEFTLAKNKSLGSEIQQIVRQAMAYINQNYAHPITRSDIAAHVGVSDSYLTRSFRQEFGVTPNTYLTRFRIQQAKKLLKNEATTVTEVALATGFSDSNYFARVFKKEVGQSPSDFQRQ